VQGWDTDTTDLRLLVEDLCCDVCRFEHLRAGVPPERIRIHQDVDLGHPNAFADIRVAVSGQKPYFVEVKWGHDADEVIERLAHKYGVLTPVSAEATRLVVAAVGPGCEDGRLQALLRERIHPALEVDVWNAEKLLSLLHRHFGVDVQSLDGEVVVQLREAIEKTKGAMAFGEQFVGSPAQALLMWHFGCWTIRRVREQDGRFEPALLRGRVHANAAILIADISGFSAYVRDTRDDSVVQQVLASFYTKTRRAVIGHGGMMSQFVGDAIIAAFGVPRTWPGYLDDALECAVAIMDIGQSVSNKWQRYIDRVQPASGCHTGLALGDLLMVPQRSGSRSHLGMVSDSVNMAARLSSAAAPGEIVVSNAFFQGLSRNSRHGFSPTEPIEAKNVGRLQAWRISRRRSVRA
jgi:class 3 adenylate cyclase